MSDVCYTFEAAVEMAVKMEDEGFRHYLAKGHSVGMKQGVKRTLDVELDTPKRRGRCEAEKVANIDHRSRPSLRKSALRWYCHSPRPQCAQFWC